MNIVLFNNKPEIYQAVQGEGKSLGKPVIFVRLFGCTLDCTWCDTEYSKRGDNINMSVNEVVEHIKSLSSSTTIIFTGGEPLLQQDEILEVIKGLGDSYKFEIETNGTLTPKEELINNLDVINCSPKLEHSGNSLKLRYRPEVLLKLSQLDNACFKFVIFKPEQFEEISNIIEECKIKNNNVYLMPKGDDKEEVLKNTEWLIDFCIEKDLMISPRLHTMVYGKKRGV